jgi:hypothetical protein
LDVKNIFAGSNTENPLEMLSASLWDAAIQVIRDYEWYMCWQVLKNNVPFGPNGEQQIKHSSPFCVKA